MTDTELPDEILASRKCSAAEALRRAPARPGYYAIFVDSPNQMQSPFSNLLLERRTRLIYIGIATKSLRQRLVEQDLLHRQPSTFFRGMGAIIGFRPSPGSLFGKSNQNNYTFSPEDTKQIIAWIDEHLSVSWIEADPAIEEVERGLIRKHFPIINTDDNCEGRLQTQHLDIRFNRAGHYSGAAIRKLRARIAIPRQESQLAIML